MASRAERTTKNKSISGRTFRVSRTVYYINWDEKLAGGKNRKAAASNRTVVAILVRAIRKGPRVRAALQEGKWTFAEKENHKKINRKKNHARPFTRRLHDSTINSTILRHTSSSLLVLHS